MKGPYHLHPTGARSNSRLRAMAREFPGVRTPLHRLPTPRSVLQPARVCCAAHCTQPVVATVTLQAYVEAFFARPLSGMRSPARQVVVVEPPHYSLLSRTNSTIHVTFTYDESVRLQGMSEV